jgi:hypothetical protein
MSTKIENVEFWTPEENLTMFTSIKKKKYVSTKVAVKAAPKEKEIIKESRKWKILRTKRFSSQRRAVLRDSISC